MTTFLLYFFVSVIVFFILFTIPEIIRKIKLYRFNKKVDLIEKKIREIYIKSQKDE